MGKTQVGMIFFSSFVWKQIYHRLVVCVKNQSHSSKAEGKTRSKTKAANMSEAEIVEIAGSARDLIGSVANNVAALVLS